MEDFFSIFICIYVLSLVVTMLKYMVKTNIVMRDFIESDKKKYKLGYIIISILISIIPIINSLVAIIWVKDMIEDQYEP